MTHLYVVTTEIRQLRLSTGGSLRLNWEQRPQVEVDEIAWCGPHLFMCHSCGVVTPASCGHVKPLRMTVSLFWPRRRLHGVLTATRSDATDTLWLAGFRVGGCAVCVVDITTDRSSISRGLDVVGICRSSSHGRGGAKDAKLLVVEYTPHRNADVLDEALHWIGSGSSQPGVVVLYDPAQFAGGLVRCGMDSVSPASPLHAPLQQLQLYFQSKASPSAHDSGSVVSRAFETPAYYAIAVPFAAANTMWQHTMVAVLSAPLLKRLLIGRGEALKDYSQCLTVCLHRVSNILTFPSQIQARYRRHAGSATYTELADFMVYLLLDYALGLLFATFMATTILPAAQQADITPLTFLDGLREHVVWLMDAPAGFKLNDRLAAILGNGILMWLDFWEFLFNSVTTSSAWEIATSSSVLSTMALRSCRHAGLTLQLSAVADAVWLLTWNSYWVFLYFTKLNAMQLRLLSSLWKLFLGKKNNVLRNRVDSCEYDVNQLLLGTLLFTILVFLVTTNAVFFVFFGIVRFGVWVASAALWIPIALLRGLPLISLLHRLLKPGEYTASLSIETAGNLPATDSVTVEDISPGRRRERDAIDQATVGEFFQQRSETVTNHSTVIFRVITRSSSLGQRFHRLQAYQAQLLRSYNGSAVVNSCLFGAELAPVDSSMLFRTMTLNTPTASVASGNKRKQE